jgi:hypothetical protein
MDVRFASRRGSLRTVKGAVVVLLIGLAVGLIVFVATSGHAIFLPLIFVPFVFFWPLRRNRS